MADMHEVYPGIYVSGEVEIFDGKNRTRIPSRVHLFMADGWDISLDVIQGMNENSGDLDVMVGNKRITGPESAIHMKAAWRKASQHLGWLVRRFTVVQKKED